MRTGFRFITLLGSVLLLGGCGLGTTISEWFEDDRKVLITRPLSNSEYEDRIRGGVVGMLIGAGFASELDHDPSAQPEDVEIQPWRARYIDNAAGRETILMNLVYLRALQHEGIGLQSEDVVDSIAQSAFPMTEMNEAVRANLRAGIAPPESGRPNMNPFADHYALAASAPVFGLLSPGLPQTAGRLTRPFGEAVAYGDGSYAAMFVASTIASGMMSTDLPSAIEAGLASIPQRSNTANVVRFVLSSAERSPDDWTACWQGIQSRSVAVSPKPYRFTGPWLAGVSAMAILYGEGDFYQTISIALQGGLGLEAPAAVSGAILGAHLGYTRVPFELSEDIIERSTMNFSTTPYTYASFTSGIIDLGREVIRRRGGRVSELGERDYIQVPEEPAVEPRISFREYTPEMAQNVSPGWAQLPAIRHQRLQQRMNDELAGWAAGWTIENCGDAMYTGVIEDYAGRFGILATVPKNESEPCRLVWQGAVPTSDARLVLHAGAANEPGANVLLSVTANQTALLQQELQSTSSGTDWQEFSLDLSAFAGQDTRVVISIIATGWDNEAAYIDLLRIDGEDAVTDSAQSE